MKKSKHLTISGKNIEIINFDLITFILKLKKTPIQK